MNSTEKLIAFIEELEDRDDSELAKILPVPPHLARMGLTMASTRVPTDAAQLDEWALNAAAFCLSMRGDDAQGYTLVQLNETVGALAAPGGTAGGQET